MTSSRKEKIGFFLVSRNHHCSLLCAFRGIFDSGQGLEADKYTYNAMLSAFETLRRISATQGPDWAASTAECGCGSPPKGGHLLIGFFFLEGLQE